MKKFYTFAALACVALTASAQAIDIDNLTDTQIEGKYRVVSPMSVKIDDVYLDEEPLVVITKTAENTFDVNEFMLPVVDDANNPICVGAEWIPGSDDSAANLNIKRDANGEAYFFNTAYENEDHYWVYLWNINFRLLPSLADDGSLQFGRQEGANPIVFQYYDGNTGDWLDAFGWYNGFTLVKQPVFNSITKRTLPGKYIVSGWDGDYNEVSYEVSIEQDGPNYTLSGLFGMDDLALTCTWDADGGGIRARSTVEYDALGYATAGVGSYAPSETLYFSFTEEGALQLDHDIYALIGGEYYYLLSGELHKGTIDGISTASTAAPRHTLYTLDGRKAGRMQKSGIYVQGGKKVMK